MGSSSAVQAMETDGQVDFPDWMGEITDRLERLENQLVELKAEYSAKVRELNNGPRFPRPGRRLKPGFNYSDEKPPV